MGDLHAALDERLERFIAKQHMFFVGTAPRGDDGHVNLSPKGLESFAVLGPTSVAYLDLVGSGAETIAHLRENGRITFLFCAFEGPPKLLRLYGQGTVLEPDDEGFSELASRFTDYPSTRAIVRVELDRIADSCGYGVPLYEHRGERSALLEWGDRKGPAALREYQRENNLASIDGLPALRGGALGDP